MMASDDKNIKANSAPENEAPPGVKALKLGDPLDETSDIGTIINEKQFRKVCGYVEEGLKRREARLVTGGLPPKEGPLSEGYYSIPTIFANVANDWRLARDRKSTRLNSSHPSISYAVFC